MVDPRTTAGKLCQQLRSTFGDELRSVVLFGSVPRGEALPGVSDLNVFVLLESLSPRQLEDAAPLVQQWIRDGHTPPHFYSSDEWAGMRDTFAIEIADMQDAREVLWGEDPISDEAVAPSDLRLHAEQEMRETLLHLRLRMLLSANSPTELGGLLQSGLPSFAAYMRAALRLSGEDPGLETSAVIEAAASRIDADPRAMLECWRARSSLTLLRVEITDPLVRDYNLFNRQLVKYLDRLPANGAGHADGAHSATSTLRSS